ncbi:hypothetical protein [Pontibacter sp. G13]|uniref:hypothetical protein n=1 Tax=Pontibacter sp. G13 TaxID=3074898 RepID=UPI00288A279A|nr:hypothetical protein [Pontibacter sp. G13]WNJ18326.1 hypothetical protein RJD25_26025 [Pontibacter sp. G13]
MESNTLPTLSTHNSTSLDQALVHLMGSRIAQIHFVCCNLTEPQSWESGHLTLDSGVLIETTQGWLSWVWLEDRHNGGPGFQLSTEPILPIMEADPYLHFTHLKTGGNWGVLLESKIEEILPHFQRNLYTGEMLCGLELKTTRGILTISGIEEPDPDNPTELAVLPFAADWTLLKLAPNP